MDTLLKKGLKTPTVYSPKVNGLVDVKFHLDNAGSGYFIPWEVRAFDVLPEVSVVATKVIRMNEPGSPDHISEFYFPRTIRIPASLSTQNGEEYVSQYQLRVLVLESIKPGSYYMHFSATFEKKGNTHSYDFSQKIILIKKIQN